MRDDDGIESRQVDANLGRVALEHCGVVAGVEEDATPPVFDQRGKSPVSLERRSGAEGVVKERDALRVLRRGSVDDDVAIAAMAMRSLITCTPASLAFPG